MNVRMKGRRFVHEHAMRPALFWASVANLTRAAAMALPFEVTCPAWDLYFILLVLRKAPGGQIIYAKNQLVII